MWMVETLPTHLVLHLQHTLHCHPHGPDLVNPLHLSQLGDMPVPVPCAKCCSAGQHLSQALWLHALLTCKSWANKEVRWCGLNRCSSFGGDALGLFLGLEGRGDLLKWIFLFLSPLSTLREPCSQLNESRAESNHISSCLCFWILGSYDLYLFLEKI